MMHLTRRWLKQQLPMLGHLLLSLNLCLGSGCQFAPKDMSISWPWKKDETKPLPDRILAVWTDSVLHQPNQAGVRGFGGRVYFYGKENTDPIEVDGSLAVYVFDADDINLNSQKPLRKFVFTADQFNEHMSKTSIGPSYSVWLPWGEIGGPPRRLSLIARFEGRQGGTTISDPTIKLLPGVPVQEHSDAEMAGNKASNRSPFRLSGFQKGTNSKAGTDEEQPGNDDQGSLGKDDIKTIDLPPSFQRHLRGSALETSLPQAPADKEATRFSPPDAVMTSDNEVGSTNQELPQAISAGTVDEAPSDLPVTTQIYDYRTRSRHGHSVFGSAKSDIRQGRWINSISR